MRKTMLAVLALGLFVGSLAGPAAAAKSSTTTTFFLHGKGPVKPVQEAYTNESWLDDIWMGMDTTEPTAADAKLFLDYLMGDPAPQSKRRGGGGKVGR